MKVYEWYVETIVCKTDGSLENYSLKIETIGESKREVFRIAKFKTEQFLEKKNQTFLRISVCWFELEKIFHISKYERFVQLHESKLPRKAIMIYLHIPFWKLREYEEYYNGNTIPLTRKGYLDLRKFLTNEQIRRRCKIPECEFRQFLKGMKLA